MPAPLVWIDCEMTGLDLERDSIIEISCFVTDGDLNLLKSTGFTRQVYCPPEQLEGMCEFVTKMHTKTGLIHKISSAKHREEVEQELLHYLVPLLRGSQGLLAGNSVHCDFAFLKKEFPNLCRHLHYRIIDVSSVNEIAKRINPGILKSKPPKKKLHTAESDILESIEELRWFYKNFFITP